MLLYMYTYLFLLGFIYLLQLVLLVETYMRILHTLLRAIICVHIYVYIYRTYIYIHHMFYICVYILYIHVCKHVCTYVYIYLCTYIHIHICTYVHAYMCVYRHAGVFCWGGLRLPPGQIIWDVGAFGMIDCSNRSSQYMCQLVLKAHVHLGSPFHTAWLGFMGSSWEICLYARTPLN